MKEKQITMSLDLAKQMLGKDEAMDMLIKEHFSDEDLCIKPKLPKKWEDLEELSGFFIATESNIYTIVRGTTIDEYKNTLPTKELAEAILAMCQLLYLRNIYNDGWQPDWENSSDRKYVIAAESNKISAYYIDTVSRSMAFKTRELRNEFMTNFKDLLEIAKPLL